MDEEGEGLVEMLYLTVSIASIQLIFVFGKLTSTEKRGRNIPCQYVYSISAPRPSL